MLADQSREWLIPRPRHELRSSLPAPGTRLRGNTRPDARSGPSEAAMCCRAVCTSRRHRSDLRLSNTELPPPSSYIRSTASTQHAPTWAQAALTRARCSSAGVSPRSTVSHSALIDSNSSARAAPNRFSARATAICTSSRSAWVRSPPRTPFSFASSMNASIADRAIPSGTEATPGSSRERSGYR